MNESLLLFKHHSASTIYHSGFMSFVSFVVNLLSLTEMLVDTHTGARIYFVVLT